jgi:hypothetical protein
MRLLARYIAMGLHVTETKCSGICVAGVSEQTCSLRRLRLTLLMYPISDMQSVTPVPSANLNSLYCARHCPLAEVAQHMSTSPRAGMFRSDILH